jgi:hypothetical protein
MPELEAVPAGGQLTEGAGEPVVVAPKGARKLPEHRAHLWRSCERLDSLVEALQTRPEIGEALHVGQVAAHLDGEDEPRRALLDPTGDSRAVREPVEGVVDLDRVKELRVVLEPAARRQPLRVHAPAPVLIVPAGAADPDLSHTAVVPRRPGREAF